MGNCAAASKGSEKRTAKNTKSEEPIATTKNQELMLKVPVEVKLLSSDNGPLRWLSALDSLVPLSVYCTQVGEEYLYKLKATGIDGRSFDTEIKVPGTKFSKSSENFIQWRDEENGRAWGLNFTSESDTDNFLKLCSPSTLSFKSEKLQHNSSSFFSEPNPDPPPLINKTAAAGQEEHKSTTITITIEPQDPTICSIHSEDKQYNDEENIPKDESINLDPLVDSSEPDSLVTSLSSEFPCDVSISSVRSDGALSSDSEKQELYRPSSPFKITEEFILPDIIEESEEGEMESCADYHEVTASVHSYFNNGDLDILETSFNEETLLGETHTHLLNIPTLPISPPPGPLLSPQLNEFSQHKLVPVQNSDINAMKTNRHSMAGILSDIPPPLPTTEPPGKLMGPRQSIFLDLADISSDLQQRSNSSGQLDVCQPILDGDSLLKKIKQNEAKNDKLVDGELIIEKTCDEILSLVPPIEDIDVDLEIEVTSMTQPRLESYHLKTLEPPKEFSDSGFHTDITVDQNSKMVSNSTSIPLITLDYEERGDELSSNLIQKIDSSTTYTSDDQLTENSGSVGLKTIISSGSEHSFYREEDNNNNGTTTEADGGTKTSNEVIEVLKPKDSLSTSISMIRKTGWLDMKTVLICKNRKVAMKSKRKWKKFWANLKRNVLLMYECEEQSALPELETVHSDLKLDLENCLAHAVHDHVKRDHLFCLSTSGGNTYYMQTTNQAEVEDWITCIHCAAAVASTQRDKDHSIPMLKEKVEELNKLIEKENQLKNLTSLNLSTLLDATAKSMASQKLVECSENLEAYKVELYRIRCYIASLQGTELPNPHSLLCSISKPTKNTLGRIGIFSVASLHAIVSARHNLHSSESSISLSKSTRLKDMFATVPRSPARSRIKKRSLDVSGPYPNLPSLGWGRSDKIKSSSLPAGLMKGSVSLRSFEISGPYLKMSSGSTRRIDDKAPLTEIQNDAPVWPAPFLNIVKIRIPSYGHTVQLTVRNDMTARELLYTVCKKFKIDAFDHFVKLKLITKEGTTKCFIPNSTDAIMEQQFLEIEICQKSLKTVTLVAKEEETAFGLTLVPEWDTKTEIDLRTVNINDVKGGSMAEAMGIKKGDEVVLINDKTVMELGWVEVEQLISGPSISLTLRTCLMDTPLSHSSANMIMDSLICPAPPSYQPEISGEMLRSLIVPTPSVGDSSLQEGSELIDPYSSDQIDMLMKDTNEISKLLRRWKIQQTDESVNVPWTQEDRLKKSISDLIETEASYVRLLNVLVERYLEPLRHETYLTQLQVDNLISSILDLVENQNTFLNELKDIWNTKTDVSNTESSLKQAVSNVIKVFLGHVDHFKQYSSFCASHQVVKQIIATGNNEPLVQFFRVRNPTTDLSLNVDSLLAKPIVRISRYPLFLGAMLDHTDKGSDESLRLKDVIKEMGEVTDHINEMQRLCETYWPLINHLSNDAQLHEIGVSIRINELKFHGEVIWLNPTIEGLSKGWKKGQGPRMILFVFKAAVILICLEKKHKQKENKSIHEIQLEVKDTKYRQILPTVTCGMSNLPDSDGVTNMWRLQYRSKSSPDHTTNYFFRSKSTEDKAKATNFIQCSIQEQQKLYGSSPSIARIMALTAQIPSFPSLIPQQLNSMVTSSTPSNLSVPSGYGTPTSDTDHD